MIRSAIRLLIVIAACVFVASAFGKPLTKQNGKSPAFTEFTSICTLPPYLFYGFCDGNSSNFTNVTGRMNAVQPKAGRYNLELSFGGLTPGAVYRLWGNNGSFFVIGTQIADSAGSVDFAYQTASPAGLGFDLNQLRGGWDVNGITLVTSYWSNQLLSVNPDGTISAG